MWVILYVVAAVLTAEAKVRIDPVVQTDRGLIRGRIAEDGDYHMFLGIPYGIVDENKPFGIASPYPSFDRPYEAYDDSIICPQVEDFTDNIIGSLDCPRLNVYVPSEASSRNKLAVLVWIHGGAFKVGDGGRSTYGPKYLVRHDVIVVALNYRLGPYGFLCLGTPDVPGNQGLKDQLLALRWIKDHIQWFGGDPNKITLMGESAGSSSVETHLLSNQEKLFNKAIMQSGTLLKPEGISKVDTTPVLLIAEKLGFLTDNVTEALSHLEQAEPNVVIAASSRLSINLRVCVENDLDDVESIITEHPLKLDILKVKGMPILVGFNDREALMIDANKPTDYFKSSTYFQDTLKSTFDSDENLVKHADIVRRYYVGDEQLTEAVRSNIVDFESDFYYNYPVQWSLKRHLEDGAVNVYQYLFSYDGGRNMIKNTLNITVEGAAHADELGYLFHVSTDDRLPSAEDQLLTDRITTLWTNFVKCGDPTPERTELLPVKWLPVTRDTYNYLAIDTGVAVRRRPLNDRLAFWQLLYTANEQKMRVHH